MIAIRRTIPPKAANIPPVTMAAMLQCLAALEALLAPS